MNRKYWCTLGGIRSFESLRKEAKTLEEILEDVNLEVENAKKRVGQNYAYSYRGQLFNERWVRLDVILGLLAEYKKQLQEWLKNIEGLACWCEDERCVEYEEGIIHQNCEDCDIRILRQEIQRMQKVLGGVEQV